MSIVKREGFWFIVIFLTSYLIVSFNSSLNPMDEFILCKRGNVTMKNIWIILQLSLLLVFIRYVFQMVQSMESQRWRFFLFPIVLFALPVSIIMVWLQHLGC